MSEENDITLTQSKLDYMISDSYTLGWNAACKMAERKDLELNDE